MIERKNNLIAVRVNDSELSVLKKVATKKRISLSTAVRELSLASAEVEKQTRGYGKRSQ
jgi:hypothetical protein